MADQETIRTAFERNKKALELRPSKAKGTAVTKVRVRDGTTCEIESAHWKFTADVGTAQGGNDAGPGPGIFERAALGSCLAIGYVTWGAYLGVPIEHVEIEVESDFDARAQFGIGDEPPGFKALRYRVWIESPASEEEILKVLDAADKHSPVRDDFARAIPIEREVEIVASAG